jgi:hypothetical protein
MEGAVGSHATAAPRRLLRHNQPDPPRQPENRVPQRAGRSLPLDQKSIWTPIFKNRGVNTDSGASQACDPVVVAGLKDWL